MLVQSRRGKARGDLLMNRNIAVSGGLALAVDHMPIVFPELFAEQVTLVHDRDRLTRAVERSAGAVRVLVQSVAARAAGKDALAPTPDPVE